MIRHVFHVAAVVGACSSTVAWGQSGCLTELGRLEYADLAQGELTALQQGREPALIGEVLFTARAVFASTELLAIDISDPGVPTVVGGAPVPQNPFCTTAAAIAASGDQVFYFGASILTSYSVSDPRSPAFVRQDGILNCSSQNVDLLVSDDHVFALFAVAGSAKVLVYDRGLLRLPNPPLPDPPINTLVHEFTLDTGQRTVQSMNRSGDFLILADRNGLYILDASTPVDIRLERYIPGLGFTRETAVDSEGRIFVPLSSSPLVSIAPPIASSGPVVSPGVFLQDSFGLSVEAELLVQPDIFGAGTLRAFDVREPSSVSLIDSQTGFAGRGVVLRDGLAYVSGDTGIAIFDTRTCLPCSPVDFASFGTLDFLDINAFVAAFLASDQAADLNGDGGFDFLDINAFVSAFLAGCP